MTNSWLYDFVQNSSERYCDTTITVVNGKENGSEEVREFKTNKMMLAYYSDYYRAFYSGTGDAMAEKGHPVERDVSFVVFEVFLRFCYDRTISDDVFKI